MNINDLIIGADWIGISIISVIEYISFTSLSSDDVALFYILLERIEVIDLKIDDIDLLSNVSEIRIKYKLKLPNAIIAATSIDNDASLITADKGFDKVQILNVIGF